MSEVTGILSLAPGHYYSDEIDNSGDSFYRLWITCCFTGTILCLVNATIWHITLGMKIDSKVTFILHYIGLISTTLFVLTLVMLSLELQPDREKFWTVLNAIVWQLNYNCYLIMFIMQSTMWFGSIFKKVSILVVILVNISIAVDSYYYCSMIFGGANDELKALNSKFDFGVTVGMAVIELIYNVLTIYQIIKQAYKMTNSSTIKLIIKLVGVLSLFFILDIITTGVYKAANQFYSLTLTGFLLSLKILTEYFCLNRIRQCLLIAQQVQNS